MEHRGFEAPEAPVQGADEFEFGCSSGTKRDVDDGDGTRHDGGVTPAEIAQRMMEIERSVAHKAGLDLSSSPTPARALREHLVRCEAREPKCEAKISLPDPSIQGVFEALCDRYGVPMFRRPRQRSTTVTVSGPKSFVHDILGEIFQQIVTLFDEWFVGQTQAALLEFETSGDRVLRPPS